MDVLLILAASAMVLVALLVLLVLTVDPDRRVRREAQDHRERQGRQGHQERPARPDLRAQAKGIAAPHLPEDRGRQAIPVKGMERADRKEK